MQDTMNIELSEAAFAELFALAKKNGLNVAEQAKRIIQEHFDVKDPNQRSQVSLEFLRQEVEVVQLRAQSRECCAVNEWRLCCSYQY